MAKDNTADIKNTLSSPDIAKKDSAVKSTAGKDSAEKPAKSKDNKSKDGKDGKPKVSIWKKIVRFFKDLKSEFKKIVWPDRKKVTNNTLVVVAFIVIVGIGIWLMDGLFLYGIFGNLFYFR